MIANRVTAISQQLFNELERAFPPLNHHNINSDTTMIEVQRNAAQQEIIDYIHRKCPDVKRSIGE